MNEFLELKFCEGTISSERFIYIEKVIKFNLPKLYKELIKNCDQGCPIKTTFSYYDNGLECKMEESLNGFIAVNETEYDFLYHYKTPPEFFPEGLVAFGENGGGDLICFDYRQGHPNLGPPIVFWNHEADIGKDVSFIAKNFEEFIDMLYEPED